MKSLLLFVSTSVLIQAASIADQKAELKTLLNNQNVILNDIPMNILIRDTFIAFNRCSAFEDIGNRIKNLNEIFSKLSDGIMSRDQKL